MGGCEAAAGGWPKKNFFYDTIFLLLPLFIPLWISLILRVPFSDLCSPFFTISETKHQSLKSKDLTPNIGLLIKKGIIISLISENFVVLKSITFYFFFKKFSLAYVTFKLLLAFSLWI